ncbi:hypothetical protein A2U01_0043148, partial [Trifolium medium]|nr:hypothetical protein [Trifolium medium]
STQVCACSLGEDHHSLGERAHQLLAEREELARPRHVSPVTGLVPALSRQALASSR